MNYQRQIVQSLGQFLVVFLTGLLVFQNIPTDINQLWQPFLQAALSALGIWGFSKMGQAG